MATMLPHLCLTTFVPSRVLHAVTVGVRWCGWVRCGRYSVGAVVLHATGAYHLAKNCPQTDFIGSTPTKVYRRELVAACAFRPLFVLAGPCSRARTCFLCQQGGGFFLGWRAI